MNTQLGMRIRALREAKNYTQEEVARMLGLSRQKLARIETGKNDITFIFLQKFSEIVGCSVHEITNFAPKTVNTEPLFRGNTEMNIDSYQSVAEMLDLFYANKQLYERVRG